ncbi:MAG TPA: hypothetical protein VGM86_15155 [Thermoanaerobaculia bacterium]|jgi:hypothetical protein
MRRLSADGNTLYFVDGLFTGGAVPAGADLVIARRRGSGFQRLPDSARLLAQINTPALEYAPATSADGLELFFTRLDPGAAGAQPAIYRAYLPHLPAGPLRPARARGRHPGLRRGSRPLAGRPLPLLPRAGGWTIRDRARDPVTGLGRACGRVRENSVALKGESHRVSASPDRRTLLLLATFLVLATGILSCGGGGGGTPSEPSNPPVSIQGVWVGTATSLSASGTCLADNFHPLTVPARWEITQSGSSFAALQTLNNAVTCPFSGTVNGSMVTFLAQPSSTTPACTVQSVVCPDNPGRVLNMELQLTQSLQTATVSGNKMSPTGTAVWRVTDAQTGQLIGEYRVQETQSLQKQ